MVWMLKMRREDELQSPVQGLLGSGLKAVSSPWTVSHETANQSIKIWYDPCKAQHFWDRNPSGSWPSTLLCPYLPPPHEPHLLWANDLLRAYSETRSMKSWCCLLSGRIESHLAILRDSNITKIRRNTKYWRGKSKKAEQRKRNFLVARMKKWGTAGKRKDANLNNVLT